MTDLRMVDMWNTRSVSENTNFHMVFHNKIQKAVNLVRRNTGGQQEVQSMKTHTISFLNALWQYRILVGCERYGGS